MKIKLKLFEVSAAYRALRELANNRYPMAIAFRLKQNIRALETPFKDYEAARYEMAKEKKYGTDQGPGSYILDPVNVPKLDKDTKSLQMEEVEMEISQISPESIAEISPLDLIALEWMFEDTKNIAKKVTPIPQKSRQAGKTPRKRH